MFAKYFTVEEANAILPWLREKFSELATLKEKIADLQFEFQALMHASTSNGNHSIELSIRNKQLEADKAGTHMSTTIQEISKKGIIVRDINSCLVDFPSTRYDRDVYLCWVGSDEQIGFWHDTNTGFADRQSL